MPENEFDNTGGLLANQQTPIGNAQQTSDQSASPDYASMYGGQPDGGQYPGASPALPANLPSQLRGERKERTAAILAGNYSPTSGPSDPGYKSVMDPGSTKNEPWIGPDGGMIGRGIKKAGYWYQGYIDRQKPGLDGLMKDKLTMPDWAVDALETAGHAATESLTGLDSPYEPRYKWNKMFQWMGSPRGSLISPTQALVLGAKAWGGQELSPSEMARGTASIFKIGQAHYNGPASSAGKNNSEFIDRQVDSGIEMFK